MNKKPVKITLISGSMRQGSVTTFVSDVLTNILSGFGVNVHQINLSELSIPIFPGAYKGRAPDAIVSFKNHLIDSDIIVILTPEYHGSVSGALKNTLDWIEEKFLKKKIAAIGCVMGGRIGGNSLEHLRVILTQLGVLVIPSQLVITHSNVVFDSEGNVLDESLKIRIEKFANALLETINDRMSSQV